MNLMQSPPGAHTIVDGREYLYFCGTGYLGLHGHPALVEATVQAVRNYGLGTGTSRHGFGSPPPIVDVEQQAATFWQHEAAYYFMSGYCGTHVLLSALSEPASVYFVDEHSHYSVADACRYSNKPRFSFAHRDPESLRDVIKKRLKKRQTPIVLSDGVFALTGHVAPVASYLEILQGIPNAMLCLDDCHGFGVLGEHGRGTLEHCGIAQDQINQLPHRDGSDGRPSLFVVGTLSKAFGGFGGIVSGSSQFIEKVRCASHYFAAASAPPTPVAAACAAALKLVGGSPDLTAAVQRNARLLRRGLLGLGLDVDDTPVPVVGIELGTSENMQRIQQGLAAEGILIAYKAAYSGISSDGMLRIATFSSHTDEMIQKLLTALERHL